MRKIIPCLDIKNGRVVKGINFEGLRDMGDPVTLAQKYSAAGADELVFLDITRTEEGHALLLEQIRAVKGVIDIPLTVGGGIQSLANIENLLEAGADKVAISSYAVSNPHFINEASEKFGREVITIAIDAGYNEEAADYFIYTQGGKKKEKRTLLSWAAEAEERGAGRLLITSIDRDGVQTGFDLKPLQLVREQVELPIIASGGAGSIEDFIDLFQQTRIESGLAASIFHQDTVKVSILKEALKAEGIEVQ